MVSVLLNSASSKELGYIESFTRHLASKITEEGWEYHVFRSMKEVLSFLEDSPLLDIACVDLTLEGGLDGAKGVRALNQNTFILVIADKNISPMTYISPEIMACGLLLRPYDSNQLKEVVTKTVKTYFKKFFENENKKDDVFVVESKEGKQLIPYERISCFEARDKKIFAVTDNAEYSFYDTMDSLEGELPRQFVRSHRGFIVNVDRVVKVQLSQSTVVLDDGSEVPLSRSYKSKFKDILTA